MISFSLHPWGSLHPLSPLPRAAFLEGRWGTHRLATAAVQAAGSPLPLRSHIHTLPCENLAIPVGLRNHCLGAAPLVGSQSFPGLRPPPVSQRWGPEAATCVVAGLRRAQEHPIPLPQSLEGNIKAQRGKSVAWHPLLCQSCDEDL